MFRLALALGKTVNELLDNMTSWEYSEWQAFDAIEPIGAWRMDYNFGMLCALNANMNRSKGSKAFSAQDFMPFLPQPTEEEKMRKLEEQFMSFATAFKPQESVVSNDGKLSNE